MKKILIIDDNSSTVETLKSYLSDCGYEILTAFDGVEGLEIIKNKKVDLIITDNVMPKLSGIEFVKTLHSIREKIPVIVISAYSNLKEPFNDLNIYAFMLKPINIIKLEKSIEMALMQKTFSTY